MAKDYDEIEYYDNEDFFPNIKVEADELPDSHTVPISLLKFMFSLNDNYDIEEDTYLSDKISRLINAIFEDFDEEVIDFDYDYDEENIYVDNIIWS